jgi:hypothetical protein
LLKPFSLYKFDDPVAGMAVLLTATLTAIERPFLPVAPIFVIRSSMPATGKGLIMKCLAWLAFGAGPVMITWGGSGEEFEKRLGAVLLKAPAALSIDNTNDTQIKGALLESMTTESRADIRPLGSSDILKVQCRPLITLTGNNPVITGDMARRAIPIDIVPRSADPERDIYAFDPFVMVQENRTALLQAAYAIMRAFRQAGMPSQGLPAVGSFGEWSRHVRDLVYWVTGYDVSQVFRQNKMEDPHRQNDAALLAALHQQFGAAPFTAAKVDAVHKKVLVYKRTPYITQGAPAPTELALHEALDASLGPNANAKLFGYCVRRLKGAYNGGFILETQRDPITKTNNITVRTGPF